MSDLSGRTTVVVSGSYPAVRGRKRRELMSAVRRHPLITFWVLTYAISWGFLPIEAVGFIAGGPFIAALIVTSLTQGGREILRQQPPRAAALQDVEDGVEDSP